MLLGVYTLMNTFAIFLYIKLIAKHTQMVSLRFYSFIDITLTSGLLIIDAKNNLGADKEGFVKPTATILAVPASSIIWYGLKLDVRSFTSMY